MYNSGFRSNKKTPDGVGTVASQAAFVQLSDPAPTILSWSIQGSDDRALDPAGGQTVVIKGAGFTSGMTVTVGTTAIGAVTIVNSTQATFTSTAKAAGNYTLTMANSNGQAAILVPGLAYSTVVTWTTPAGSLGSTVETTAFAETVVASADSSITYTLASGTLPTGATLNGNGTITGTAVATDSPTTYSFAIIATDAELQDSTQSFTITVDPDSVTWVSPANGTNYTLTGNQAMANVTLSATAASGSGITYAANALPTGVSLTGSTISGTPTVAETVSTLLTATANTTSRSSSETITWVVSIGDIYWPYVSLLLNGATPTTTFINDASLNNNALTIAGDTKPNLFTPYESGYYSNYFDGTGDYLTAPSTSITIGTGDFTLEGWFYFTGTDGTRYDFFANNPGFLLYRYSDNNLSFYTDASGTNQINVSGFTSAAYGNRWLHIALTRQSGNTKLFINGTQAGSTYTSDTTNYTGTTMYIGRNGSSAIYYSGYISNFRVVTGTALYTSTFTPPTSPLPVVAGTSLLTCRSNQLVDTSIYNLVITKNGDTAVSPAQPFVTPTTSTYNTLYSVYNTGTAGYVDAPLSSAFTMGTGDYTVECWFYIPSSLTLDATAQYVFDQRSVGGSGSGLYCYVNGTADGFSASGTQSSPTVSSMINVWTHIACTRTSGTAYLYMNGVQIDSGALSTDFTTDNAFRIGSNNSGAASRHFPGYISNLRVVKGQALYTGTFTPPTATLTANSVGTSGANVAASITGSVALLCHQNNTLIDNSPNNFTLTSTGTKIQPAPASPFTMTTSSTTVTSLGSAYFDGSDVLVLPANQLAQLGTQDFTLEAWINTTSVAAGVCNIFDIWNGGQTSFLLRRSGVGLQFYVSGGSSIASSTLVANTWIHVAAVRTGTTVKLYQNGISVGTPLTNYSTSIANTAALGIGGTAPSTGSWNGYIADARIVVGTALYTANFLPPQAPLTPVTNTSLLTCQYNGGANNNGFVDQSSFNNLITRNGNTTQGTFSPYSATGWSNYFNSVAANNIYNTSTALIGASTSTFTMESWIYMTENPVNLGEAGNHGSVIIPDGVYNTNTVYMSFGPLSDRTLHFQWFDGAAKGATYSTPLNLNQWYHVAVVVNSNAISMYVNGVSVALTGTTTLTNRNGTSGNFCVGGSGQYQFVGYVSNARVTNTAVYTSNFTPNTTPLTTISGTSLLTCQTNRFIDNSPNNYALTPTGTPTVQAYSPFGGVTSVPASYSNYFDGTGDWLTAPDNASLDLGSSDFTIEGWFYQTGNLSTSAGGTGLVTKWTDAGNQRGWQFSVRNAAGTMTFYYSTTGSNFPVVTFNSVGLTLNTWTHLALVRTGNTLNLYKDGSLAGTSAFSSTIYDNTSPLAIGAWFGGTAGVPDTAAGNSLFQGYVSNVRVVKGVAVYTGAFTPPTSPLTATQSSGTNISAITGTQTSLLTCQSNTIVDNSPNYFAITANGDTKPYAYNPFGVTNTSMVSYTPSVNGGSMYFDGTGDYLTVNGTASATLPGDFTIEFWAYPTSVAGTQEWVSKEYGVQIYLTSSYWGVALSASNNSTYFINQSAAVVTNTNTWYHIAVTRSGNNYYFFVNGIQQYTTSSASTPSLGTTVPWTIGAWANGSGTYPSFGYISDVRIFNGTAVYKANFYPGSAPATPTQTIGATTYSSNLLLNGTSGGIIDYHGSNDLETVGNTQLAPQDPYAGNYYSVYFDGTGDYLTVPNSTNFAFGTGDFTVEFWMRTVDTAGGIVAQTSSGWAIAFTGGVFYWQSVYNVTNLWTYNSLPVTDGKWHHVAFVRASGTTKLYYDGVEVASNADSTNYTVTSGVVNMGSHAVGDYQGNLSNIRVIKGTALYTTAFTPSTAPLTTTSQGATANQVSLLTLQSNKFIDNSTNNLTLTVAGTPGVNSSNPFQQNTGKSLYFDGTGDYLKSPSNTLYSIGTGDYTLEFWVYSNIAWSGTICLYNNNSGGYFLQYSTGTGLQTGVAGSSATGTYAVTLTSGTWNYIAVSRASGSSKCFVNGTQVGSTVSDTTNYAQNGAYIGALYNGDQPLNGYIKDLRVTKGVARYTTTFTPPTTPDQTK